MRRVAKETGRPVWRRWFFRIVLPICLILLLYFIQRILIHFPAVGETYAKTGFIFFSFIPAKISSLVPISLSEVFIITLALSSPILIAWMIIRIRRACKQKRGRKCFFNIGSATAWILFSVYFLFMLLHGLNFTRYSLDEKLGFSRDERICFTGPVYDQELLKKIREKAYAYLHGHSVGGTNPSLLEALGSTKLNLLFDVGFNREVGENAALYWTCENGSLSGLIKKADQLSDEKINAYGLLAKRRIEDSYRWESITSQYQDLFHKESADLGKGK